MMQPNPRYHDVKNLAPVHREHYDVARSLEGWYDAAEFKARYLRMYPRRAQVVQRSAIAARRMGPMPAEPAAHARRILPRRVPVVISTSGTNFPSASVSSSNRRR